MAAMDDNSRAEDLFREAYRRQVSGQIDKAIELYTQSIALHPTAEAHTYRAWAYSTRKRYNEAISECMRAIEIDPDFGNPYNDIGACYIELGNYNAAEPWLLEALDARRYEERHFAHYNLGRVYERQGKWLDAVQQFSRAYALNNNYHVALMAQLRLQARLN